MHASGPAIFFIVWGLVGLLFYRHLAEAAVFWREKTKSFSGTTTQRRQEVFALVLGTILVGIGVLFLFVEA